MTHRNTKLFLFLMSGPFFLIFCCVKYSLKLSIMYYLYKKGAAATMKTIPETGYPPKQE